MHIENCKDLSTAHHTESRHKYEFYKYRKWNWNH